MHNSAYLRFSRFFASLSSLCVQSVYDLVFGVKTTYDRGISFTSSLELSRTEVIITESVTIENLRGTVFSCDRVVCLR